MLFVARVPTSLLSPLLDFSHEHPLLGWHTSGLHLCNSTLSYPTPPGVHAVDQHERPETPRAVSRTTAAVADRTLALLLPALLLLRSPAESRRWALFCGRVPLYRSLECLADVASLLQSSLVTHLPPQRNEIPAQGSPAIWPRGSTNTTACSARVWRMSRLLRYVFRRPRVPRLGLFFCPATTAVCGFRHTCGGFSMSTPP